MGVHKSRSESEWATPNDRKGNEGAARALQCNRERGERGKMVKRCEVTSQRTPETCVIHEIVKLLLHFGYVLIQ